jgi:hypothetical protein
MTAIPAAVPDHRHDQHQGPVGYFEAFEGMVRHVFTVPVPDSEAGVDPERLADDADEAG